MYIPLLISSFATTFEHVQFSIYVKSNIFSSKRFQLDICNLSADCRHGNAHAITILTVRAADIEWLVCLTELFVTRWESLL